MHYILAPALKPLTSVLDLQVPFKNRAVSGNRNKKQKTEKQEHRIEKSKLLRSAMYREDLWIYVWQGDISGSFIDPGIQLGTGLVLEELQSACLA